jgi:hypothetical protein
VRMLHQSRGRSAFFHRFNRTHFVPLPTDFSMDASSPISPPPQDPKEAALANLVAELAKLDAEAQLYPVDPFRTRGEVLGDIGHAVFPFLDDLGVDPARLPNLARLVGDVRPSNRTAKGDPIYWTLGRGDVVALISDRQPRVKLVKASLPPYSVNPGRDVVSAGGRGLRVPGQLGAFLGSHQTFPVRTHHDILHATYGVCSGKYGVIVEYFNDGGDEQPLDVKAHLAMEEDGEPRVAALKEGEDDYEYDSIVRHRTHQGETVSSLSLYDLRAHTVVIQQLLVDWGTFWLPRSELEK